MEGSCWLVFRGIFRRLPKVAGAGWGIDGALRACTSREGGASNPSTEPELGSGLFLFSVFAQVNLAHPENKKSLPSGGSVDGLRKKRYENLFP